jgi:hypothetical protein
MTYFISGHRDLTQEEFNEHYAPILEKVLKEDWDCNFVLGDWEGCDKMSLEFILSQSDYYDSIEIFYVDKIRIRPFGEHISNFERLYVVSRSTYDDCDETMTKFSDFDIAWVRPGREDSHTAMNIKRRYYGKV